MNNFDLQMRFMNSALDAWFGYAAAGVAAWGVLQEQANERLQPQRPQPTPALDMPFMNPFAFWSGVLSPSQAKAPAIPSLPDFGGAFFQFAQSPWSAIAPGNSSAAAWQSGWTDMLQSCCWTWPQASWSLYRTPMTAMLMGAGFPYSVAAPMAQANTASMDAFDAARLSFDQMVAGLRSDDGDVAAPMAAWNKMMMLMAAPWLAALEQASPTVGRRS